MPRERLIRQSLGGALHTRVKESRVLMVGAGGIGCELLKNLVLTGFGQVHIVDLDTIDLSNLNRQFLFRHEHIKKSKALVAKESAQKFNPNVTIEAHHANIKDSQFNLDWFKSFDIVFNALDNLEARRHVNRMCLAADVPLIDGGTTGFEGYVQVIKKGQSECYDCNAKETPKSFPVCTIRSTPSQPIHCIVWAKSYLFAEIFGTSEEDAPDLDTTEDTENAKEIEALRQEAQALKRIRESTGSEDFSRQVFEKVYKEDVERLRSMEDMWKTREKPESLDFDKLRQEASKLSCETVAAQDQKVWTAAENFAVFEYSVKKLAHRLDEQRAKASTDEAVPILSFDKDDKDTLDFVSAAANLRSAVFHIELKSEFDIKQMAGNIIPAIATTNAMIAGLCVLQSFKILRDEYSKARISFLTRSAERVISSEPLGRPRPDCPVCSVSQSRIEVDLARAKMSDLVESLLRVQLGYGEEFSVSSDMGLLFDPDFDDNLSKKFTELSIGPDSLLTIIDEDETEPRVNLVLSVSPKQLAPEESPIKLTETVAIPRKPKPPAPAAAGPTTNGNGHSHENGQTEPNGVAVTTTAVIGKRKRSDSNPAGGDGGSGGTDVAKKKGKVQSSSSESAQGARELAPADHEQDERVEEEKESRRAAAVSKLNSGPDVAAAGATPNGKPVTSDPSAALVVMIDNGDGDGKGTNRTTAATTAAQGTEEEAEGAIIIEDD